MKVLLYFESKKLIATSGIGRAMKHQMKALELAHVEYTTNPSDDYDILHINTVGMTSQTMISSAKSRGKKVIYHAHSTEEDFKNSFVLSNQVAPIFKKVLISLYSQADAIITPTPYSKSLIENYGIDLPIYPISNGIELSKYEYDKEKVKAFYKYFSLKETDKIVISVGLYFERKGILDFIEVARQLPNYKFIWFGYTNPFIIPTSVRDVVYDHPDNVFFPGYIKGGILEGAYASANCFFFPSYEETEGIVVLEALASKQHVIVRDIGVFNPWLQDKVHCYKGNNNDEFVQLIEDVVEQRLPDTSENAYLVAEERSLMNVGFQLKEVYENIMKM